MSLYDGLGIDSAKEKKGELAGWSSGIKLLQSQLQLKKAVLTQVKKESRKGTSLPPVVDLKARKDDPEDMSLSPLIAQNRENKPPNASNSLFGPDPEWNLKDEYDPMWPNDYEKIIKDRRDKKEKEREEDRRRDYEERERRRRERYNREPRERDEDFRERRRRDEEEEEPRPPRRGRKSKEVEPPDPNKGGGIGAAIAPPPSLVAEDERKEAIQPSNFTGAGFAPSLGGSVAAKIMAKYGFKEGQGLGKQEQGMSQALQVEKTSKRGGKIIHERDVTKGGRDLIGELTPEMDDEEEDDMELTPQVESITEAMKNPSKVVLLRNMVAPGEVDEELEPETKEECAKYGEVHKCVIFEIADVIEEEAVRIFVEFKRIESAIKAVVDLNGRFFGGRVVRAGFYNVDKFRRLELGD